MLSIVLVYFRIISLYFEMSISFLPNLKTGNSIILPRRLCMSNPGNRPRTANFSRNSNSWGEYAFIDKNNEQGGCKCLVIS
jgi:hypothetical protein